MNKSILFKLIILLSVCFYQPAFADAGSSAQANSLLVNLNTANEEELSSMLYGIGLSKAQAIVAYRDENGNFGSIDDLILVSGIGIKTLEENRPLLTIE